jgi:hypothetical protein
MKRSNSHGRKLTRDVDRISEKIETSTAWRRVQVGDGLLITDIPMLMATIAGALHEAIVYLAHQMEDPTEAPGA